MTLENLKGKYTFMIYFVGEDGCLKTFGNVIHKIQDKIDVEKTSKDLKEIYGESLIAWQIFPFNANADGLFVVDERWF